MNSMKHLYDTCIIYSRFKLIPVRVILTKLIIVKSLILIIITSINMTNIINIFFSMYGSACGCVRQYEHHSTLHYLLPSMYDFMID